MECLVDFKNLREITGGDVALEKRLIALFLSSSTDCLNNLRGALEADDKMAWQSHAHGLKSICVNVGAALLSTLCQQAQTDWQEPEEKKRLLFEQIEGELAHVHVAIDSLKNGPVRA